MTDGQVADVKAAWHIAFAPDTIVGEDRGDNDYRLFAEWTDAGVCFVTRMKDNAQFEVVEERAPPQNRNILNDQTIRLTGTGAQKKCPHLLRRVEAVREDTGDRRVCLTNHHGLGAEFPLLADNGHCGQSILPFLNRNSRPNPIPNVSSSFS